MTQRCRRFTDEPFLESSRRFRLDRSITSPFRRFDSSREIRDWINEPRTETFSRDVRVVKRRNESVCTDTLEETC